MARLSDASWNPKSVGGRAARRKGRCVILHVAVSEAQNLMPGPNADWHFYVAKNGAIYQYIDTDLQAFANGAANATAISVETQGGVKDADREPWTEAQVRSLAKICRWAHDTEGIPLTLMPDSRPGSRGIGYHRLGVDPWRVSGGESWSSARGKICPGAAKIAQIPQIIALAAGGSITIPPSEEDEMTPQQWKYITDMNTKLDRIEHGVRFMGPLVLDLQTRVRGGDPNIDSFQQMTMAFQALQKELDELGGERE